MDFLSRFANSAKYAPKFMTEYEMEILRVLFIF